MVKTRMNTGYVLSINKNDRFEIIKIPKRVI